ncbi:hypothetical protein QQF64_004495 [Cirrhinus molitorella]|uniref:Uncharacterized protein n=1 Tax=Cirrhinus molitorella TaxID=172907 RepID=A0ABR3MGD4_9TELE
MRRETLLKQSFKQSHIDSIWTDLKPYLENLLVENEQLLEKINMSYSLELERKSKLLNTRPKNAKVATVCEEEQKVDAMHHMEVKSLSPTDYRLLNEETHPDQHPIPQIQKILENLGGTHGSQYWTKEKPTIEAS